MGFKGHLRLISLHFLWAAEWIDIIQHSLFKYIWHILIRLHLASRLPDGRVLRAVGTASNV